MMPEPASASVHLVVDHRQERRRVIPGEPGRPAVQGVSRFRQQLPAPPRLQVARVAVIEILQQRRDFEDDLPQVLAAGPGPPPVDLPLLGTVVA
jgi:hypothetical protein